MKPPASRSASAAPPPPQPLTDDELAALQALIDTLTPTLEPLDVVMIDGYLCGVLLQPEPVPETRWLPLIMDVDGRPPPAGFDVARLRGFVRRRHAELDQAISERDWFDLWVYELDEEASPSETVLPWVAGFATAVDAFTELMDRHEPALLEPLAALYRHLDPDDLEDADELLAEIETYEPAATVDEAVEDLVRSVLLIADESRPLAARPAAPPSRPAVNRRAGPPRHGGSPAGPAAPAKKAPASHAPARNAPARQTPAKKAPAKKTPSGPGGPRGPRR